MKQTNKYPIFPHILIALAINLLANLFSAVQADNAPQANSLLAIKLEAEKPVAAKEKVVLHGEIDMLSAACKEVGLTLSANTLPSIVDNVLVASPAYFADIKANDKIISADFKDNKFCISLNRAGTPYYTEIRLSPQAGNTITPFAPNPNNPSFSHQNAQTAGQMMAIGFRYFEDNHQVNYVDPNSDLFGKVHVGDIYMSASDDLLSSQNNDSAPGTMAYPVFKQNGVLHRYPCRRKPINSFVPDMAQRFRNGFGAIYVP